MSGHIYLQDIGKAYKRYARLRHKWLEVLSFGAFAQHDDHWVLRDIHLEVQSGEALGLIGYNGAGKSTLLKLIAGVTRPSTGRVVVGGRVAAILELGVGFHPELSGRQNIPLAGQLLGFSVDEMALHADEVVAFAELGDMIDQPLRAYSSGMMARLAFAVATAVRPDILIVDEALSVGDAYFQHKSFSRIRHFQEAGTTILFVSHDFNAVRTLCKRVILLGDGRILRDGSALQVLDYYNALIAEREQGDSIQQESTPDGQVVTRSGSGQARLVQVDIVDAAGRFARKFATGEMATFRLEAETHAPLRSLVAGILIRDRAGNPVFGTNSWHLQQPLRNLDAGMCALFEFLLPINLGAGSYSLTVALTMDETHLEENYDWWDNALVFEVANLTHAVFAGTAYLPTQVSVKCSRSDADDSRG